MDGLLGLLQVLMALSLACWVGYLLMVLFPLSEEAEGGEMPLKEQRSLALMEAWAAEGPEALADWRSFVYYGLGVRDFLHHRWTYYWQPRLAGRLKGGDHLAPWPWEVRRWLVWNYGQDWHDLKAVWLCKLTKALIGWVRRNGQGAKHRTLPIFEVSGIDLWFGLKASAEIGVGYQSFWLGRTYDPPKGQFGWPQTKRLLLLEINHYGLQRLRNSYSWKMDSREMIPSPLGKGWDLEDKLEQPPSEAEVERVAQLYQDYLDGRPQEQDEVDTWVVTVEAVDAVDAVDFYWHLRLYPSLDGMVRAPLYVVDMHSSVGLVYALNEVYQHVGHEEEALLLAVGLDGVVARQAVELGVPRYDEQVQRLGRKLYEYYRNRQ